MKEIRRNDGRGSTYGAIGARQALKPWRQDGQGIPGERTVNRLRERAGPVHEPKLKSRLFTKADRLAPRSDDLVMRYFPPLSRLESG